MKSLPSRSEQASRTFNLDSCAGISQFSNRLPFGYPDLGVILSTLLQLGHPLPRQPHPDGQLSRRGRWSNFIWYAGLVLLPVLSGCAPSVLLKQEDPIFDYASERLQKDLGRVAAAPFDSSPIVNVPADKALFIQAESFYWYRFSLPQPSARALATKALAAATDFAPMSVWAASTEMNQLRMQSYNGATQLYEHLVERYPNSDLKPFALYRLGWAYRNVGIEGFSRNGNDALEELVAEYPSSPFAPFAKQVMQIPFKTQEKAAAWSLIPGAGQMYVGECKLGVIHLSIATTFAAMAAIPPIVMVQKQNLSWVGLGISAVGVIGLQVTYTIAYEDAQHRAITFNERQEREFENRHPEAP